MKLDWAAARGRHVQHPAHGGGRCQDVGRARRTHQDGADRHAAAGGGFQHVVEDVGRIQVGADQPGWPSPTAWFQTGRLCGFLLQRGIAVQLLSHSISGCWATNKSRAARIFWPMRAWMSRSWSATGRPLWVAGQSSATLAPTSRRFQPAVRRWGLRSHRCRQ